MELEWESEFETGNEYVDLQHRYFLDLINRIRANFKETDDVAYKGKLINELRKYADQKLFQKNI
jgi:hemerythrin